MTYILAFYEIDREYGGPEEGGWWYNTGELIRICRVFKNEDSANKACRRANDLIHHIINRHKRDVGSVAYSGGQVSACVFKHTAPKYFPTETPHYE